MEREELAPQESPIDFSTGGATVAKEHAAPLEIATFASAAPYAGGLRITDTSGSGNLRREEPDAVPFAHYLGGSPWHGGVHKRGWTANYSWRKRLAVPSSRKPKANPTRSALRAATLWHGPLVPLVHYGALLLWGALDPPPAYIVLCGAVLLAVHTAGTYAGGGVAGRLAGEREASKKSSERARILRELHDGVKQNVRGASMMIEACVEAQRRGADPGSVRKLLIRALEMSQEAEHQLSKPLEELELSCRDVPTSALFKARLKRFGEDFDIRTSEHLDAPLELLPRLWRVIAYRVCVEACWNVARHARAENLWLESRLERGAFVLVVRDDGLGFRPGETNAGLGLRTMRTRAQEAGAVLEISSAPGRGTSVSLRFEGKQK